MKLYILAVIVTSFFEIKAMLKNKQKKAAAVFSVLALAAIALGVLHYAAPYKISVTMYILNLLGLKE
ncbi:MAG: hypothetical protein PHF89_07640 [Eubacteriales bacterium]|jgi:hypothetical protein|nr:hypothetical protein [Eubacteriales bacterium]